MTAAVWIVRSMVLGMLVVAGLGITAARITSHGATAKQVVASIP